MLPRSAAPPDGRPTDRGDTYGRSVAQVKDYLRTEALREARLFPEAWDAYAEYASADGPADLCRRRDERLGALLERARTHVPFYRDRAIPVGGAPLPDLAAFPLVGRADLRSDLPGHCDDDLDPGRCRSTVTSGTSGEPLRIIHDRDHFIHSWARAMARNGSVGRVVGRRVLLPFQKWLDDWFLYSSPARGQALVAEFGVEGAGELAGRLLALEPDTVVGHPADCLRLAEALATERTPAPSVDVVWTFGEHLASGARATMEQFIGAPVRDLYGLREAGTIAAQCARGGYHLEDDRVWVEIVDDDGHVVPPGTPGEVVVTNLFSSAMPLIRYRTGDIGALSQDGCDCGAATRMMNLVEGRNLGTISLPGGDHRDVLTLTRRLRRFAVDRFQLVQDEPDRIRVLMQPSPGAVIPVSEVLRSLSAVLPDGVAVEVHEVDWTGFVTTGTRKATDFVSLIRPDEHGLAGPDRESAGVPDKPEGGGGP